ncbi:type II toxin-antitoxin system RelE/ParE family toxin, partial [Candidatus Regiella insecticola]
MKLIWTRPASEDRKKIREYIAHNNPMAALIIDELLSEKASRLLDHPC